MQAISFLRAQGLPIESGRNHRSACFQQSLLPAVFPTFPCDTNIPGYMALTLSLLPRKIAGHSSFIRVPVQRQKQQERCLPSPAALVIPSPSLTRAFGNFERQACEIRHDRNSFWDFHSGREGFRMLPGSNPAVWRKHSTPASFSSSTGQKPPYPGAKSLRASDSHQAGIYPYNKK